MYRSATTRGLSEEGDWFRGIILASGARGPGFDLNLLSVRYIV